jgi:hypothetical protein
MTALTADQLADLRGDLGVKITQLIAVLGFPTGGTFTLSYKSQTSAAIAYNADSTTVEAALQALSTVGIAGVLVTGASAGPWTVKIADDDGTAIVADGTALTGGTTPTARVVVNVVFTDTRLNRLWARAAEDYNTTVVYALRQLLADDRLLTVYSIGIDGLNKQKVFENTLELLKLWERIAGTDLGSLSAGTISTDIDYPDFSSFDEFFSDPLLWSGF